MGIVNRQCSVDMSQFLVIVVALSSILSYALNEMEGDAVWTVPGLIVSCLIPILLGIGDNALAMFTDGRVEVVDNPDAERLRCDFIVQLMMALTFLAPLIVLESEFF